MESEALAKKIMTILEEKKATDILALDISEISTLADYFILASAENVRQLDALEDAVEEGIRLEVKQFRLDTDGLSRCCGASIHKGTERIL